jgi:hypothetical protein
MCIFQHEPDSLTLFAKLNELLLLSFALEYKVIKNSLWLQYTWLNLTP